LTINTQVSKQVKVAVISNSDDELYKLLIHEIAHAVIDGSHGVRWMNRYEKAGKIAEKIGRKGLAESIYVEIGKYKESPKETAEMLHQKIWDTVLDISFDPSLKRVDPSYDAIIEHIARGYGCYREEFEAKYKKCRKVFNEAMKFVERQKMARAKFEALLTE